MCVFPVPTTGGIEDVGISQAVSCHGSRNIGGYNIFDMTSFIRYVRLPLMVSSSGSGRIAVHATHTAFLSYSSSSDCHSRYGSSSSRCWPATVQVDAAPSYRSRAFAERLAVLQKSCCTAESLSALTSLSFAPSYVLSTQVSVVLQPSTCCGYRHPQSSVILSV